jgi:hypothetical protein
MKKFLGIISAAILMASCSSPLSDIAISDPNLITPIIKVEFNNTEDGKNSVINTCLTDKNGAYIELKEGEVAVNGKIMNTTLACYNSNMNVDSEKKYTITVTLADSAKYDNTVTTPAFFEKVNYPNKIDKGEGFNVDWSDNYNEETMVIFEIKDSSGFWTKIYENEVDDNRDYVSKIDYPAYDVSEGKITLQRIEKGTIADGFNGGKMEAKVTYERFIKIR